MRGKTAGDRALGRYDLIMEVLSAPVGRSIALATVLACVAFAQPHHKRHRLRLHAEAMPHAIYLSVWDSGDLYLSLPAHHEKIVFETRARISDGCEWLGIETLVPIDATRFAYDYSEEILSCEPGAIPAYKTPRQGIVTVDE